MAQIDTNLTHEGVTYAATIVTIDSTELGREDHGIFHAQLRVSWSGSGTSIGGYVLDDKPNPDGPLGKHRTPTAFGLQWIIETVETVLGEYGKWEDLPGSRCFMLHDQESVMRHGFQCKGIASLDGKRVMIFDEVAGHVGALAPAS